MLIARAPLRISFGGGGTDLPAYYERYGGLVVSTTIDKYVYVHVAENGPDDVQIASADYRTFYRHHNGQPMTWDGDLALPRAVLHEFGVERGLSLFLASEVPPGTGLGSSSAIAVALVSGIAAHLRRPLTRRQIADLACQVEIEKLKAPIGKQDQFAAAFGGLNAITFSSDGVVIEPIRVAPGTAERLESRLMLFFTGTAHNSADILRQQQRATAQEHSPTVEGLHRIKAAGLACRRCLESGDIDCIGALLDEGWHEKRRLAAGITNPAIDELYDVARASGAAGGKITGAGGGGFLLLYCEEARQEAVTVAMEERGLRRMGFRFDRHGVCTAEIGWAGCQAGVVGAQPAAVTRADETPAALRMG